MCESTATGEIEGQKVEGRDRALGGSPGGADHNGQGAGGHHPGGQPNLSHREQVLRAAR